MKKSFVVCTVVAGVIFTAAGNAAANEALANQHKCMACHAVDKKVLGPGFKDVAKKYAADKSASNNMQAKIKNGSTGVWGPMPMPPNTQVPDADVKKLADWILSLK